MNFASLLVFIVILKVSNSLHIFDYYSKHYLENHENWPKSASEYCGVVESRSRIIGGSNAILGEFPWMARIGIEKVYGNLDEIIEVCGGTLISEQYVLTAGHCFSTYTTNQTFVVILGDYNLQTEIDCSFDTCADPVQWYRTLEVVQNYNETSFLYDIALVRLDRIVEFTRWVKPVCLPNIDNLADSIIGKEVTVLGWGYQYYLVPEYTTTLQKVMIPIFPIEYCQRLFVAGVNFGQLCAGVFYKDSCFGDSGGPAVMILNTSQGKRYVLVGIVSFGASKCGEITPSIYTDVSYYMNWILDNMN